MVEETLQEATVTGPSLFTNNGATTVPTEKRERLSRDIPGVVLIPLASSPTKRVFDFVLSAVALLVLLPLFLLIALAIKITSAGPVVYRGPRYGLGGKVFYMIKFRSMHVDAEQREAELFAQRDQEGPVFKMKNDPRVTPVGRFLRRYSLDELPQLIHVFLGEMSLVGPRALTMNEVDNCSEDEMCRVKSTLRIKPGITCFWQVGGRSSLGFDQRMDLDERYIREANLWTDVVILAKTPSAVLRGDGAY